MDINKLIENHTNIVTEIESLEERAYSLSLEIREATNNMTKDELLAIYPKIKDSTLKFDLFMKIKNMD